MAIDKKTLDSYPTVISETVGKSTQATQLIIPSTCKKVTIEALADPIYIATEGTDGGPISSNRSSLLANGSKEFMIGRGRNRNNDLFISSQDTVNTAEVTIWFEES